MLRSKHSGWTWEGRRTPFVGGGGGGGPSQTTSTSYSTNIPEYARPYVENMLGATQRQLFTFGSTPDRQVQIGTTEDGQPIFETKPGDQGQITGFKPYQAYGAQYDPQTGKEIPGTYDPTKYVAGFQPLQESAMRTAGQLGVPGQYGTATDIAGTAGIRALGAGDQASALGQQALGYGATGAEYGGLGAQTALARAQQTARQAGMYGRMGAGFGQQAAGLAPTAQAFGQEAADIGMGGLGYGAMGAGYGGMGVQAAQQGFGAGQQFAQQATDPNAVAAYMSPYMQNVVDYQKSQALRDFGIGQQLRKAQAVGAGAFGGSRQAIAESEAERALGSQLQGIAATGSQKAFEDAQRQQQFGAQLGLQGLQAGYGGLGLGMQGAGMGLQGLGTALQGQQARMAGLGQAGQFLGQGMQGAGVGLQGVGAQQAAGQLGLAGTAQGMQGAGVGLQGVQGALGAGQYGLQGLGQATQAASALGQLGGQQLGAQKDIIGLQSQLGAQQQAREQQIINQAIQDWANAQQYPLMQLGVMSNMLRGLPMQSATTNQYVAAPNALTQGIGTIGALGSLGNVFRGGKEGGMPSEFKAGIKSFDVGGEVESKLYDMDEEGLQKYIQSTTSDTARRMARRILREKTIPGMASGGIVAFQAGGSSRLPTFAQDALTLPQGDLPVEREETKEQRIMREYRERQAAEADRRTPYQQLKDVVGKAQAENLKRATEYSTPGGVKAAAAPVAEAPPPAPAPAGITTVPGTSTVTNVPQTPPPSPAAARPSAASAAAAPATPTGIKTGNPELDKYIETTLKEANAPQKSVSELAAERRAYIGPDETTAKERSRLMAERVSAKDEATRQNWMRMAEFFAAWGTTPGNSIVAGLTALKAKVPDFINDAKEQKKILKDIDASIYGLDKVERLEKAGEFDKATELKQKLSADLKGKVGNIITFQASNLSSQRSLEAARTRAETTGGGAGVKYNDLQRKVLEGIDRARNGKDYQELASDAKIPVNEKSPQMLKDRVANAKAEIARREAEFARRKKDVGITDDEGAPSAPAPSANVVDFSKLPK